MTSYYCCAPHSVSLANGRTLAPGDVADDLDTKEAGALVDAGQLVRLTPTDAKSAPAKAATKEAGA